MLTVQPTTSHQVLFEKAIDAGIPKDQMANFVRGGYVPFPSMLRFHAAAREADRAGSPNKIALGGTRGPGKSHAVLAQVILDDCQRFDGLKALFLRKIQKSAAESLQDLTIKVCGMIPHKLTNSGVDLPNGSRVVIGGYKDDRDIEKYLGIEYDLIALEEATQVSENKYDKVRGSMRSTRPGWRTRLYLTTNADGIGLAWFKKQYVIPARERREVTTRFFDVHYSDNPLLDQDYIDYLEGLKGNLRKAWKDADWDAFSGMAHPSWNYTEHVIEPFAIPDYWPRWRAIDWGRASPWCCLWFARDPDIRRIYVYREAYQAGLSDKQQAERILDLTSPSENVTITFADPSMWARKTKEDEVFSTFDEYKKNGVLLTKADNNRIMGKRKIDNALATLPDRLPGLQIFSTCVNIVDQMSNLAASELNPEDIADNQEDHAWDTLRYGLTNERIIKEPGEQKQERSRLAGIKNL